MDRQRRVEGGRPVGEDRVRVAGQFTVVRPPRSRRLQHSEIGAKDGRSYKVIACLLQTSCYVMYCSTIMTSLASLGSLEPSLFQLDKRTTSLGMFYKEALGIMSCCSREMLLALGINFV